MGKKNYLASLFLLTLGLSGCQSSQRAEPPPPAASSPAPEVEPSTIVVPIEVSLGRLSERIEQRVPRVLTEKDWNEQPEQVRYKVSRGNPQLSMNGPVLHFALPIHCEIEAKRRARRWQRRALPLRRDRAPSGFSCKTSVTLRFSSTLQLTPDWRLTTQTRPGRHEWTHPCELPLSRMNVIDIIDRRVVGPKLEEVAQTIDQRVAARTDFRDKVVRAWNTLQEPVQLREQDFWLALHPQQITLAPLEGGGQSVHTTLRIIAQPQIIARATPPAVEKKPLPDNHPSQVSDHFFHIALAGELPFEQATAEIRQRVVDRSFEVAGQTISVEDARVFGNGDLFVLEVRLRGALAATLYLTGIPHYNPDSGEFSVEQLDFSVETRNLLVKVADWFLHGNFQEMIAARARFSLGERIEEAKHRLEQGLNRQVNPRAKLKGTVSQLTPRGVYITPTSFKALVVADGQVSLLIQ